MRRRLSLAFITALLSTLIVAPAFAQKNAKAIKPPETFTASAQAIGQNAGLSAQVTIRIEQYTTDKDRGTIEEALKTGAYDKFLSALRSAPEVGSVEMNGRKFALRWARQQPTDKGRLITLVTESPMFFVGGGGVDAKPRAGYEVAVLMLDVDSIGLGTGSMAPAARVRQGGSTGVQIDDYGDTPVKLVTVRKSFKP